MVLHINLVEARHVYLESTFMYAEQSALQRDYMKHQQLKVQYVTFGHLSESNSKPIGDRTSSELPLTAAYYSCP